MIVYLAGRFSRQAEFRTYRDELQRIGITVTSRWIDGHGDAAKIAAGDEHFTDEELAGFAAEDLADIERSDLMVAFTETPDAGYMSGGRHVEYGYALALGKSLVIVGPMENVFHRIGLRLGNNVPVCPDWHSALIELAHLYAQSLDGMTRPAPRQSTRELAARA